jgi:hypothetical protein
MKLKYIGRTHKKILRIAISIAFKHRFTSIKTTPSKQHDSDESYSEDEKSSTSGSEIYYEYVLETSCNLAVNRNEKQVSQNLFFSRK